MAIVEIGRRKEAPNVWWFKPGSHQCKFHQLLPSERCCVHGNLFDLQRFRPEEMNLPPIKEHRRLPSPAIKPQALSWNGEHLVMGSRDLRMVYRIEPKEWKVVDAADAPGIPWAAVAVNGTFRFTIGEGDDDDRYVHQYKFGGAFSQLFACPELTGSYLSHDGQDLYLSQWYKKRILKMSPTGEIVRSIDVGEEICGHTFVDGSIYVLRGHEKPKEPGDAEEYWHIARLDPREETPEVTDLARVPFACRSLTFDGEKFWSNHRAADEIVSFSF